jgi:hypothetical protein
MLRFDGAWRFDSPGEIAPGVVGGFSDLITKVAGQFPNRYGVIEHFKQFFAKAADEDYSWSSSLSWAESDLERDMNRAGANAPRFIEAFYDACEALLQQYPEITIPDATRINRVLYECEAGYEVAPPNLICRNPQAPVPVPPPAPSMRQQAQEAFQRSLTASEKALAEGNPRQAVSELLWLMESFSTAFSGVEIGAGTVEGKYFNKIVGDLKRYGGPDLKRVLTWIEGLHGYLSSPTGGGVRHGADLRGDLEIEPNEGRLYCNLIRSYITYLMAEHERLTGGR